jgi:hypothetical protein
MDVSRIKKRREDSFKDRFDAGLTRSYANDVHCGGHSAVQPPSIERLAPVIDLAASEQR